MARKRLGEILIQAGVLDDNKLRIALGEQRRWGGPLGRILVEMKLVSEDVMVKALSHQLNLPIAHLENADIPVEVLDLVTADLAEQYSVIPFGRQGNFLDVAMADPTNLGIIDEIRIRLHLNIRPYLAGPKAIERALARFYNRGMATINYGGDGGGIATMTPPDMGVRMFEVATDHGSLRPAGTRPIHRPDAGTVGPPSISSEPLGGGDGAPSPAAARRAQQHEFLSGVARDQERTREIEALQGRVQQLEALVARDEDVLRKILSVLLQKGLATREEILERMK